jgi:hypothetical protein
MRKLFLIVALALTTAAWAQTAGMNRGFDQEQPKQGGGDWYQNHLNPYIDQFTLVNRHVSPEIAGIVDQQDQFNGARPGAMAANAGERTLPGQEAMASNAGAGEGSWYDRKVQADATLNSRALAAIRSNPDIHSADVE